MTSSTVALFFGATLLVIRAAPIDVDSPNHSVRFRMDGLRQRRRPLGPAEALCRPVRRDGLRILARGCRMADGTMGLDEGQWQSLGTRRGAVPLCRRTKR